MWRRVEEIEVMRERWVVVGEIDRKKGSVVVIEESVVEVEVVGDMVIVGDSCGGEGYECGDVVIDRYSVGVWEDGEVGGVRIRYEGKLVEDM